MKIKSRLNSSTFWVFEPVFTYVWSKLSFFVQKALFFYKIHLNTGSKTQNVEELSLNLPHFEFLRDMFDENWSFLHKNEDFDQIYSS